MAERVHDGALQHPLDRLRSSDVELVFLHWTMLIRSGGQSLAVHSNGSSTKSPTLTVVNPTEAGLRVPRGGDS